MAKQHLYAATVEWTGNLGRGTADYKAYSRDHEIRIAGRPPIPGSSDPAFRGDPGRHNPEDLLIASLSGCHMLWYLHLCAVARIIVTAYVDEASGTMIEEPGGAGRFIAAVLRPRVTLAAGSDAAKAAALHAEAHAKCFIANSVNFPVTIEPQVQVNAA